VVVANVLLGVNQGLCWSTTVIMKIDLVGPARRGLAMGLNEFAGYLAVSLAALASGYLAATYALRPQPFYLGVAFALAGLVLSIFFVRESHGHARHEATLRDGEASEEGVREQPRRPSFGQVLLLTSWRTGRSSRRARPAWSITSTTAWPGGSFPSSSPRPA
jgi:MFS family permease